MQSIQSCTTQCAANSRRLSGFNYQNRFSLRPETFYLIKKLYIFLDYEELEGFSESVKSLKGKLFPIVLKMKLFFIFFHLFSVATTEDENVSLLEEAVTNFTPHFHIITFMIPLCEI